MSGVNEEFAEYGKYFHHGLRVEIGIRMPNLDVFREWGVVQDYRDDLIEVELSRDYLPENVKFELGSIVDLGVWINDQVHTCNAIVVEKRGSINFLIRLLSSVTIKERREFFRLGVSVRMKYSHPSGLSGAQIRSEWQKRAELEQLKYQEGVSNYLHSPYIVSKWAHLKPSGPPLMWVDSLSMPATVCGGGIRFLMPQEMAADDKLNLELHLPLMPTRVVHAVAEVVHAMDSVRSANSPEPFFPTGLRFVHLEERDRDLLIKYISAEQMEQLRKLSNSLRYREITTNSPKPQLETWQRCLRWAVWGAVLCVAAWIAFMLYQSYRSQAERNEIEESFGQELGKYRNKRQIKEPGRP